MELKLLFIEDNQDHADLILHWLKDIKIPQTCVLCKSGKEFNAYVEGLRGGAASPNLVILDLGLPDISGFEILDKIKAHVVLKSVAVIVYTASEKQEDLLKTYKSGGAVFLKKSSKKSDLLDIVQHLRLTGMIV